MKKIENMRILPLLIASAALLYSCDKKVASSTETSEVTTPMNDSTNVADTNSASGESVSQDAKAIAANSTGEKPALNPEHGQPYHRCEIPVGAPIDSAPPQSAAPQVMPQQNATSNNFNTSPISPSVSSSPAPMQASGPKPANNPAHGEPHHRCDLQVGAPLT